MDKPLHKGSEEYFDMELASCFSPTISREEIQICLTSNAWHLRLREYDK